MDKFGVSSKASKKAKLEAIVKAVDSLECESTSVGDTWEELITGTSASVEGKIHTMYKSV